MIDFRYLCYSNPNAYRTDSGRKYMWGVFFARDYVAGGHCYYLCWGSPAKPLIRRYHPAKRGENVFTRIKEMRQSYRHIEVDSKKVAATFPELVSEVEQYLIVQKLKYV